MAARVAAEGVRSWQKMAEPDWAKVHYPPIDYQDVHYYAAPKQKAGPKSPGGGRSRAAATYEKLGIPLKEQAILAGVEGAGRSGDARMRSRSTRCSTASRSRPPSRRRWPRPASSSARSREAVREHPELVRSTSASSCRSATTSSRRSTRRSSPTAASSTCRRACAARWSCRPISASMPQTPASSSAR